MSEASGLFTELPATAPDGAPVGGGAGRMPRLLRGAAAAWPAVRRWSFPWLAALRPDLPVRLVLGNREQGATRFTPSTLGAYLDGLQRGAWEAGQVPYLKEFDLLEALPGLRGDLRPGELFPRWSIRSSSAWIGPAGAHTGLHRDLLDNLAVQIIGTKRFLLAAPGTVERAGALAAKYDSWARLSRLGIHELAEGQAAGRKAGNFLVVDLAPGDALYVPRGWWHEVRNPTPALLLSGFFGPPPVVLASWAAVRAADARHRLRRRRRRQDCTCHPAGPAAGRPARPPRG